MTESAFQRDRIYTPPQVIATAHVPRQLLYDALETRELAAVRRGRRWWISGGAIQDWIDGLGR